MAVVHLCDGCHQAADPRALVPLGDLDPALYCAACRDRWDGVQGELEKARVQAVTLYADVRATVLAGARTVLKKLPDDPATEG